MLEPDWLGAWISGAHLTPQAVSDTRAAFERNTPHYVVLDDFLRPQVALSVSAFLSDEAQFDPGYGVHTTYGFVSAEVFAATAPPDRFFRYGNLRLEAGARARTPGAAAFKRTERRLADPYTRDLFGAVTGMSLGEITLSARKMKRGDFLAPHTDDIEDRCLSFIVYLSPNWGEPEGGALSLSRGDGTIETVLPIYNRLILFDARIWHHVEPLKTERARLTLGGWYLAGS
ncbi:MAG: hypothetical protein ACI9MR_000732 [Myxococcota bacterium]|jgi:hypothetical protein